MPVKIRLKREGKKRFPFYHIVVADSRAPRDGKYIERIGAYNPNTNPATIDLQFDRALDWLQNGAQPTDTCRAILSYKGVLLKKHLLDGVKKNALTAEQVESRFNDWMEQKEVKIQNKREKLAQSAEDARKSRLEIEAKVKEEKLAEIAKRNAEAAKEAAEASAEETQQEDQQENVAE